MALLEIDRLRLELHGQTLLKDVSLQLDAGQILGLVGESGSGKSLTSLAIMQLLPPAARLSGNIRVDGEALTALSEKQLCGWRGQHIGMVFQEPMTALNPLLSIGEQVAETLRLHRRLSRREALRSARATLDRVGLPGERFGLGRYPHELSGGQRQRVAIAIAIALKPKLLIADEPTTALDVTTQAQILQLLQRLAREDGIGLLLISHDLAVVAQVTDRVAVMRQGEIVEQGDTATLLAAPQHPYSRALLASARYVPARRATRDEEQPALLEARQLVHRYAATGSAWSWRRQPGTLAVDEVSLIVRRGENVGLVGESGCGKSTLLRLLLALEKPQSGEVRLFGQPIGNARGAALRHLRRHLQVVFQDPYGSFDPSWKVERLIAEPLHLLDDQPSSRERRHKVDALLDQVGLAASDADRHPHAFSGGQRQRIAIARALISEPSLIALDEAVSALDVTVRAQVLDLLAELSQRLGLSYLFVSHDLSVVRGITDRVYVMQQGRIVESGDTAALFAAPKHPFTAELLAATPLLHTPAAAQPA